MRYILRPLFALAALLPVVLFGGVVSAHATSLHKDDHEGGFEHIFFLMMENHATDEIFGNTPDAPFINQLVSQYAIATNYFGVTHPSLPNYLAAISGSFQGIWDDCKAGANITCAPEEFAPNSGYTNGKELLTQDEIASATNTPHMFSGRTIVDQLEQHGLSWKAYMQAMPSVGFTGEYYPVDTVNGQPVPRKLYAQKHNPFMYFSSVRNSSARMQKIVPFTQFTDDLNSEHVPNFVWISPDQCHDMHGLSTANAQAVGIADCASPASGLDHKVIKLGDDFIQSTVTAIMASHEWKERAAIVIAWDEDDYAGFNGCCYSPTGVNGVTLGGAHAPFMVITSRGTHHIVDSITPYNHYVLLATIEDLWDLGCLAKSCYFAKPALMTRFFE